MTLRATLLGAAALAGAALAPSAQAQSSQPSLGASAAAAFADVCLPASEGSRAPRDLAQRLGFRRDAAPPASLIRMLPLGAGTASFTAPSSTGKVSVISTAVPPPATIYSCMVAVTDGDDATWTEVTARLRAARPGYADNAGTSNGLAQAGMDLQVKQRNGLDRILGVRIPNAQPGAPNMVFLAYRVD